MKYTRYDLGKRKNNDTKNVMIVLVVTLLVAFTVGTIISKIFIKTNQKTQSDMNEAKKVSAGDSKDAPKDAVSVGDGRLVAVQLGVYENKDTATETKNKVKDYGTAFLVEDGKNIRVMMGIYNGGDAEKIVKTLKEKGINNYAVEFKLNMQDNCNNQVYEILNAEIQILSKLCQKDAKAFKVDELKKYVKNLKDVDKSSKNIKVLNEVKNHINGFGNEISKEKIEEEYAFVYKVLRETVSK